MFTCTFSQEGWRPKYHIYSPGMKPGGGTQHKPALSKNGKQDSAKVKKIAYFTLTLKLCII